MNNKNTCLFLNEDKIFNKINEFVGEFNFQ